MPDSKITQHRLDGKIRFGGIWRTKLPRRMNEMAHILVLQALCHIQAGQMYHRPYVGM